MKINLETTELWVTKAESWLTAEEDEELYDAISFLLIPPFTYRGLIYKYDISMDAQAKAKYKLAGERTWWIPWERAWEL